MVYNNSTGPALPPRLATSAGLVQRRHEAIAESNNWSSYPWWGVAVSPDVAVARLRITPAEGNFVIRDSRVHPDKSVCNFTSDQIHIVLPFSRIFLYA